MQFMKLSKLLPDISRFVLATWMSLSLLAYLHTDVSARPPVGITQRKINDYAAAIEGCRQTIVDSTGLRQAAEPLPAYVVRVCMKMPGEGSNAYRARVGKYVEALEKVSYITASCTTMPALKHSDSANTKLWSRTVKDFGYMPKRMIQVEAAWKVAQTGDNASKTAVIGKEILITLQLALDAYNNLRDARP